MTANVRARGICPVCRQEWALRFDGTMRAHRDPLGPALSREWCDGSMDRRPLGEEPGDPASPTPQTG